MWLPRATFCTVAGLTVVACASVDSATTVADSREDSGSSVTVAQQAVVNVQQDTEIAQVSEVTAAEQQDTSDELVCRREAVVGSHFRVRRCYTRDQLAAARQDTDEFLQDQRSRVPVGSTSQ